MLCGKAFKVLFKKKFYLPGAVVTALIIFSILSFLQQFLFFEPFSFFVPPNEILMFSFIVAISVLSGLTIPLVFYKIFNYKFTLGNTKEFAAIVLGISAGCGCSIGISLIAITGTAGSSVFGFLNLYQNYIMMISIGLLTYSFLAEMNFISKLHCPK